MTASGALLFVIPLLILQYQFRGEVRLPFLAFCIALLVTAYLVCRYASTHVMVKLLSIALLAWALLVALDVFSPLNPLPFVGPYEDSLKWAQVAAAALCGFGLLIEVRWAKYIWYAIALGAIADYIGLIRLAEMVRWEFPTVPEVILSGLMSFLFFSGGTVAVLKHFGRFRPATASSTMLGTRGELLYAILCLSCVVGVALLWNVARVADTEDIADWPYEIGTPMPPELVVSQPGKAARSCANNDAPAFGMTFGLPDEGDVVPSVDGPERQPLVVRINTSYEGVRKPATWPIGNPDRGGRASAWICVAGRSQCTLATSGDVTFDRVTDNAVEGHWRLAFGSSHVAMGRFSAVGNFHRRQICPPMSAAQER